MGKEKKVAKRKKRVWLRVLLIIVLLLAAGAGIYGFMVYKSLSSAVDTMHAPIKREKSEKREETITLEKRDPISVLMLGVDEREGDKGRSDTMIVLTVNPETNSVKMLSIPRDTRTEIIGHGTVDKINHAYAFGGEEMSIATVEDFLDIPIDYYVKINMQGFKDIVDAVGGITVNNDKDFTQDGHHFPLGSQKLDGDEALSYVRMRKEDADGDFGRQERQRQIIQGVINKGASFSSLTRFDNIFDALGKNVRTNLTFSEMADIQKHYKDTRKNIDQLTISGNGQYIGDYWYLIVSDEEQHRVQEEMRSHLGLQ
ncbi:LytR family transcriptional regulator [Bacillus infantis]|uniref:polyisoprenyl-teichoic acid--peptidoglycan teichoic acid transferase TagU n=1 Tax=Bacillus infantis TaxID=324767 RepID=UPI0020050DC0|nr:LytR family transcriptional regulator [Bacillus infantis]MCK6206062.1 LytR family transcriptional regulator [Bacillus infantis]